MIGIGINLWLWIYRAGGTIGPLPSFHLLTRASEPILTRAGDNIDWR